MGGSGQLEFPEIALAIQNPKVQATFRMMGLEVQSESAKGLFDLLDFERDGKIEVEEFITAVHRFHGQARSIDVLRLHHDCKKIATMVRSLAEASLLKDPAAYESWCSSSNN